MNPVPDRRTTPQVPIEILTHMEERLTAHATHMEKVFTEHTEDEMERYQEILAMIHKSADESEKRHAALSQSINAYTDKTEKVFEALATAFPKKEGKPDFVGHATAHETWIEESKERKELVGYIKKVVFAAAGVAVCSWITLLIWQGVLHGPVR